MQADFMKMPFPDNSFDAVYAIEATCHAPDAVCDHFLYSTSSHQSFLSHSTTTYQFYVVADASKN